MSKRPDVSGPMVELVRACVCRLFATHHQSQALRAERTVGKACYQHVHVQLVITLLTTLAQDKQCSSKSVTAIDLL